ncbi:5'-amp-activated protein kinase subunit beta-2 [Anaeramoeba flamelloides]|uniref:5'-amp-activated protein kinase subunit beta-2 n=1 Tax=Anaeramoeba flamelloides TaxID=1746091 RepID=A0ABQ8YFN6_9EUKA|nr:5'-amp-activated protein kinase subunit beta-2 [Anaeramoeba flamelloides]
MGQSETKIKQTEKTVKSQTSQTKQSEKTKKKIQSKKKKVKDTPQLLYPAVFRYPNKNQTNENEEIFIKGSFSDWKPLKMSRSEEDFSLIMNLPQGEHEFQFVTKDDKTVIDPNQDVIQKNDQLYQVLNVKEPESMLLSSSDLGSVLSPNEMSSEETKKKESKSQINEDEDEGYSQKFPTYLSYSKKPPKIPPQLRHPPKALESSLDSSLLAVPSHVVLSHLYTITRDDVAIYSCTNRYKKKYYTIVLYKPLGN